MSNTQKIIALIALGVTFVFTLPGGAPIPFVPTPAPIVSPFESDKPRVLIVEEQADRGSLPKNQIPIFTSKAVRDYLKSVGGELRVIDKDSDVSLDAPWVQSAWKVERKELPVIVIGSPKGGESSRLPNDEESTLALLKKYGG